MFFFVSKEAYLSITTCVPNKIIFNRFSSFVMKEKEIDRQKYFRIYNIGKDSKNYEN